MTLDNLSKIGRLKPHQPTRDEVARLLASADTALRDARLAGMSTTSRLDLAYKAIMQAALAALYGNGYRPSTNEPGHQQTTIQALPKTVGLTAGRMTVLDGFRRASRPGRSPVSVGSSPVQESLSFPFGLGICSVADRGTASGLVQRHS